VHFAGSKERLLVMGISSLAQNMIGELAVIAQNCVHPGIDFCMLSGCLQKVAASMQSS
jgi:hypothetical protein